MANPPRPPMVDIDMDKLATLMRFKPTLADAAAFFKCSEDTIERRIRAQTGLTYAEFRDQNMVHTRFSLVQKAIDKALKGDNIMLIFCLKNLAKWSNKDPDDDPTIAVNVGIPAVVSDEQLQRLIDKAREDIHEK